MSVHALAGHPAPPIAPSAGPTGNNTAVALSSRSTQKVLLYTSQCSSVILTTHLWILASKQWNWLPFFGLLPSLIPPSRAPSLAARFSVIKSIVTPRHYLWPANAEDEVDPLSSWLSSAWLLFFPFNFLLSTCICMVHPETLSSFLMLIPSTLVMRFFSGKLPWLSFMNSHSISISNPFVISVVLWMLPKLFIQCRSVKFCEERAVPAAVPETERERERTLFWGVLPQYCNEITHKGHITF